MSALEKETKEIEVFANNQLACISWPTTIPQPNAQFAEELKEIIITRFQDSAGGCRKQINDFTQLRNLALNGLTESTKPTEDSLNNLKRYYCQLASMVNRFKDCQAAFTWKDSRGKQSMVGNLEFELNNVMYNLAACHNNLGAGIPKDNDKQLKAACHHFKSALWWLTELRDNRSEGKSKEMSSDMLSYFIYVTRGQAYECLLCGSIRLGHDPKNMAKISAQIYEDHENATRLSRKFITNDTIRDFLVGSNTFRKWQATTEFKQSYYKAIVNIMSSYEYSDVNVKEIGFRIARLRIAKELIDKIEQQVTMSEVLDREKAKKALEANVRLIATKLEKALFYNETIYHAAIPSPENLPVIKLEVTLITPAEFNISKSYLEPEFKDLFSNLISMEAVEVNSIYSQKKDDLARDIKKQVIDKDEQLAHLMSTLNLSEASLNPPSMETPDELMEICAELSMIPNVVDDVLTKLEDLDDKLEQVQETLSNCENQLLKQQNKSLDNLEELRRLKSTNEEGLKTTSLLHKQLNRELQLNIQALATTNDPAQLLPKINLESSADKQVVGRIKKLKHEIDEIKRQRVTLLNELSHSIEQDDVIKHVVVASSEKKLKDVFEKEIKKHDKFLKPLLDNLKAQDQVLDSLEKANAEYGEVKINYKNQRKLFIEKVEAFKRSYQQFKTLSVSIDEGHAYSKNMLERVKKFASKIQATNDFNDLMN